MFRKQKSITTSIIQTNRIKIGSFLKNRHFFADFHTQPLTHRPEGICTLILFFARTL
jgi:hypothetical protein